MSPWTKVLDGGRKEDTTPLLPESDPPDLHRERDFTTSRAASSSPVDEYPDPVKPSGNAQHASHHGYPAIGVAPPPVYASGDIVAGHPVLPQATEPPAPGHSQLVTNEHRIVQQPMNGNAVVVCCHQCGHVGPALVTKESGFVTYFASGVLCFLGCVVLSIFPFCCDYTKDWVYRCSNCGTLFGRERP